MSDPEFSQQQVRNHYAQLAGDYAAQSNVACDTAYRKLVREFAGGVERVAEIGCGAVTLLEAITAPVRVGFDLSFAMVAAAERREGIARVVAEGERLPLGDASMDRIICINVIEHVPDPSALFRESARVLRSGGVLLAVTPNGDLEAVLDIAEKLRLKLPEGPHDFLRRSELCVLAAPYLAIEEHRAFLAFPAGPAGFVEVVDKLAPFGVFQYLVARKS